jgi:hypothetical protein
MCGKRKMLAHMLQFQRAELGAVMLADSPEEVVCDKLLSKFA